VPVRHSRTITGAGCSGEVPDHQHMHYSSIQLTSVCSCAVGRHYDPHLGFFWLSTASCSGPGVHRWLGSMQTIVQGPGAALLAGSFRARDIEADHFACCLQAFARRSSP
jgi:hypothetical protein